MRNTAKETTLQCVGFHIELFWLAKKVSFASFFEGGEALLACSGRRLDCECVDSEHCRVYGGRLPKDCDITYQ